MTESFPSRYCNREQARREFGADADRYASYYLMGDPIAEDLAAWLQRGGERAKTQLEGALERGLSSVPNPPSELRRFFERAESIPSWVDFAELRQGALAYQRFGILGMIVLSAWSLINGYHSSAAVKPLAFTGQLRHNAQRRLAETARFVSEASQVDGLRRGRPGYEISLRVALIHAHVRSACARSSGWRTEEWGIPINQADMLGTLDAYYEANGLARALNGPEIADNLGIPNDLWKYSEYPVRAVLTPLERLRRVIPGASSLVAHTNNTIIRRDLERILRGAQAEFDVA